MRSRRVIIGVLLVATLLAVLAVRRVLEPEALRRVAESQLTSALGAPVAISRIETSYFPVPAVSGTGVTVGRGSDTPPWLRLRRVVIVPALRSLFSHTIVVRSITVEGLDLAVRRARDGGWQLPVDLLALPPSDAQGRRLVIQQIRFDDGTFRLWDDRFAAAARDLAVVTGIAAELGFDGQRRTISHARGEIGSAGLSGSGRFGTDGIALDLALSSLTSDSIPALFALAGASPPEKLTVAGREPLHLSIAVTSSGAPSVTGQLALSKLALGSLTATHVSAPIAMKARAITLDPLTFAAYGGSGRTVMSADIAETLPTWRLRGAWDRVDVGALLDENTTARDKLEGRGRAHFDLRGVAGAPLDPSLAGSADVVVENGRIRNFPMLDAINRALRLAETADKDIVFDRLSATLGISRGTMRTDDLRLDARDMQVTVSGAIGFDQRLAFQGTAVLSKEKTDEIVRRVPEMSRLRTTGLLQVPVKVGGTLSAPDFDIDVAAILQNSIKRELERGIQRQLKRIFKP